MNSEDTIEEVRKWLGDEGFALELETAKAYQNNGFSVNQSVYYKDAQENKTREIDLDCKYSTKLMKTTKLINITEPRFTLRHIIECKSSHSQWIILGDKQNGNYRNENKNNSIWEFNSAISDIERVDDNTIGRSYLLHDLLVGKEKIVGHGIIEKKKKKENDDAYNAVRQVISASDSLVNKTGPAFSLGPEIIKLVVVTNSLLYWAYIKDNEIKVELVNSATVKLERNGGESSLINIVRSDYLETYLKEDIKLIEEYKSTISERDWAILKTRKK